MIKIQYKKFKRIIRFWKKDQSGVTAIEFSLVGAPFILMVIGILEMSLMFTAQNLLEAATTNAARLIRTGQVQEGGGETAFQENVCDFTSMLIPCDRIQYQVETLDNFGAAEGLPDASFDDDGNLENQGFEAGGVSDVVLIRIAYKYAIKTPLMQVFLTNNGDSNRFMVSTVVLKTEPYQFEDDEEDLE